jgi:hypothetical protein
MSGITLEGTISMSPGCSGGFPGGVSEIDFGSACGCPDIAAQVATGIQVRKLTAGSYLALDVGTGKSVTKALFLYMRVQSGAKVRMTTVGSPDVVGVSTLNGILIQQFPPGNELKLLEIDGNGSVEYLASGNE